MFEMIFTVCLAAAPERCFEQRPPFQPDFPTLTACLFEGQFWVIEWLSLYPNLRLKSWRCEAAEA